MRTQLNTRRTFSFVVLERQATQEKLKPTKKNSYLYGKRNLLWLSIAYTLTLVAFILL